MSRRANEKPTQWALGGVALVLCCGLVTGCPRGPKGDALMELEQLRDSNYTRTIRTDPESVESPRVKEVRERAYRLIRESDRWYEASIEAWEAAEDENSEELARQGTILYRAAEAYSRGADARERMEQANANYQVQLERLNRYNDMVAANEEVISLLLALQALYSQVEDCMAEQTAWAAGQDAAINAQISIAEARAAQREAENKRANDWQETLFDEGVRFLVTAVEFADNQAYSQAAESASSALSRFREAMTQSQDQLQEHVASELRSSRNQNLFEQAVEVFGDNVFTDARGIVVVVPNLFIERRSEMRQTATYQLDQLADLAEEHRRFDLVIEGHTSDAGTREANLTLSRNRAEAAKEYLSAQGVSSRRMDVQAYGEDYPRYDNRRSSTRSDNNRIEVVFEWE